MVYIIGASLVIGFWIGFVGKQIRYKHQHGETT